MGSVNSFHCAAFAILAVGFLPANGFAAPARTPAKSISPSWSRCYLGVCKAASGDSLKALSSSSARSFENNGMLTIMGDPLIEQGDVLGLRLQYEAMVLRHEREGFDGLDQGPLTKSRQRAERESFSNLVVDKIKDGQIKKKGDRARKAAEKDAVISRVAKPAAVVAAAYAITLGRPVTVKVSKDVGITSETHFKDQHGSLAISSPLVNSTIEYQVVKTPDAAASAPTMAADGTIVNPQAPQVDRVKVSLSRTLSSIDLAAGMTFGLDTRATSGTLSKGLTPNLRAVVGSSTSPTTEQDYSARLLYGITF